jgi:hypothetical protein
MRLATSVLIGAAALALAGCDGEEIIDGEIATVSIVGNVTTVGGDPVAGAVVDLWAFWPLEEGPPYATDTTDASGNFKRAVWTWGSHTVVDVQIIVTPPEGSGLLPDTALREGVVLNGGDDPDAVRIDLVLQPGP